jgi:two-component system, sensor histidine kinase and response regulator
MMSGQSEASAPSENPVGSPNSIPQASSGKKVLVIDDSEDVRFIISETLNMYGFRTFIAKDGASGIQLAKDQLPDLILCDVNMPGTDGYATLTELHHTEATAGIPFVFLSGVSDKINMRRGMELGADDYLTKPFTHKELLAAVNARLEKLAEAQRRSEKKLEELRGNISLALPHELRTPLNGIIGLSSILVEDYNKLPPEEILESARYIYESALRLNRLIENFLVYSQVELMASDDQRIEIPKGLSPIPIDEVITPMAHKVAERFSRESDLQLDIKPELVRIPAENLSKIVEELVDNAFKFSKNTQPVQVSAELRDRRFQLTITDYGRGMTAEQIAKIGPHMQFDRATYEQQGAGLGLVIARRLTELLGGQLTVVSQAGEQTTVRITFPQPA